MFILGKQKKPVWQSKVVDTKGKNYHFTCLKALNYIRHIKIQRHEKYL